MTQNFNHDFLQTIRRHTDILSSPFCCRFIILRKKSIVFSCCHNRTNKPSQTKVLWANYPRLHFVAPHESLCWRVLTKSGGVWKKISTLAIQILLYVKMSSSPLYTLYTHTVVLHIVVCLPHLVACGNCVFILFYF